MAERGNRSGVAGRVSSASFSVSAGAWDKSEVRSQYLTNWCTCINRQLALSELADFLNFSVT